MSAAVLISATGALNSTIMTGARIPFAVASDFPRFQWFCVLDPRFGSPKRSLILNSAWSSVLVVSGNFEQLLFFSAFGQWFFFALTGASIFRHRAQGRDGGFLTPAYPFIPLMFTATAALMCFSVLSHSLRASLIGAMLMGASIPVYWWLQKSAVSE